MCLGLELLILSLVDSRLKQYLLLDQQRMVRLRDQKGCIFSFQFIDLAHCSLQSRSTTNIFCMPWMILFFPLRFNVSFNVINSKERLCVENHNEKKKKKSKKKNTFILVVVWFLWKYRIHF